MEGFFLIIWFYVYAGLMFGKFAKSANLFPTMEPFWQVIYWPGFLCIYLFNRIKDSKFGWFVRYCLFTAKK